MIRQTLLTAAAAAFMTVGLSALAQEAPQDPVATQDPIAALIAENDLPPVPVTDLQLKATLYHSGAGGVGFRDSLGCRVVPMRTLATDPRVIPKRSVVYIKETVGMVMPDGEVHDGLWYATDTGGAIKGQKVDLYTGDGRASMQPFHERKLSLATLNAAKVGTFTGCPEA